MTEDLLVRYLAESGARCPGCRYELRGATADRCPECGLELRLRLAAPRRRGPAWAFAVAGCAASTLLAGATLAALLGPVLDVVRNPRIVTLVAAGRAPSSQLPSWSAVACMSAWTVASLGLTLWLWTAGAGLAAWTTGKRVAASTSLALLPLVLLGLLYLAYGR